MDMTEFAVEQAISTMWNRYDEPLSLNEIADSAILSKFYFSRVFRTKTGTSPGRFLAAIRLHRAKNLLLESPISVTEVAFRVGYNSLGTFTSRFTRSVGVSPGRYRVMSQSGRHALLDGERPAPPGRCTIRGVVRANESEQPLRIYVGAFSSPVVEGLPVSCDILYGPGPYVLRDVPAGVWYVRAAAVNLHDVDPRPWTRRPCLLGPGGRVLARTDHAVTVPIDLRPASLLDVPILLALPELDNQELQVIDRLG